MGDRQGGVVIRPGQGVFAGLIAAAVIVVLSFGGFLIGTADRGPSGERLPGPIVILPDPTSTLKSPVAEPTPLPVPIPAPVPPPIPVPPPVPAPDGGGQVPPPPADDDDGGGDDGGGDDGGGDDGGDDGGGGDDDDG